MTRLGHLRVLDALAQLVDLLARRLVLAELAADRARLLAQHVLALAARQLLLHLRADLLLERADLRLAREVLGQALEALLHVERLEQALALVDRRGRGSRRRRRPARTSPAAATPWCVPARTRSASPPRSPRTGGSRCGAAPRARGPARCVSSSGLDARAQVRRRSRRHSSIATRAQALHPEPLRAVARSWPCAARAPRCRRVYRSAGAGLGHLGVARGDGDDQPIARQRVVDQPLRALGGRDHRRDQGREQHGVAQRQHRQLFGQRLVAARARTRSGALSSASRVAALLRSLTSSSPPRRARRSPCAGSSIVRMPFSSRALTRSGSYAARDAQHPLERALPDLDQEMPLALSPARAEAAPAADLQVLAVDDHAARPRWPRRRARRARRSRARSRRRRARAARRRVDGRRTAPASARSNARSICSSSSASSRAILPR